MRNVALYLLGFLLLPGCSSVKNMPPGAYRLNVNKIEVKGDKNLKAKELEPYLRQRPNKTILFGIRFHLGMYNAAPDCDSCWLGRSMRQLGEAPVVFDPDMVAQSDANMEQYLRSRGYYHTRVKDTVIYNKHKAKVIYTVYPDTVTRIRSLDYKLGNDSLARAVLADSANTLLKPGEPLSTELMTRERERLVTMLHNKAFYTFSTTQIAYLADTLEAKHEAGLEMHWATYPETAKNMPRHHQYKIRNITIYSDYDQLQAYADTAYNKTYRQTDLPAVDTAGAGSMRVYYHDRLSLRKGMFLDALQIRPGDDYKEIDATRTYNNFTALNIFKVVNIHFEEVADTSLHLIDCIVRLSPSTSQGLKFNLDVSVSTNALFGISPAVSYFHKNLFRGGEYFNISFSGNFQVKLNDQTQQATEFLVAPSLSIPKFLFPGLYYSMRDYKPRSEFSGAFSHQFNPDYTRNSLSFSFGYSWKHSAHLSLLFNPVNLNVVNVYDLSQEFYDSLTDPFLRNRYQNHFVLGAGFSVIYTNRSPDRRENSIYLRWNVKTAGNFLSSFNNILAKDSTGYLIGGTPYSQFAKTDLNLSFYWFLNENAMLAYRVYGGIGRGYGNSISMPLEENYFSGGANSLRGWQARTLGPGSAKPDTIFSIPNQIGDLKLEANIEFRYKIIGALEGAIFLEGGNIWSLNPDDSREGALFKADQFYTQLALNTGLGLRLNFGFLIFRLDWGVRVHDPLPGKGWISTAQWFKSDNSTFHFGIGYPF